MISVLIIGCGSIGLRHAKVLKEYLQIDQIDFVTKRLDQKFFKCFKSVDNVENISKYSYFIIANETHLHLETLKLINSLVSDKTILVEKPLFHKTTTNINLKNRVFVAYQLRYHPVIQKTFSLLENENVFSVNLIAGQYLPFWRPAIDYRSSYSANISTGGGVLNDLSHEIDYFSWMFGRISEVQGYTGQISNLQIDSDDVLLICGRTEKNICFLMQLDYISKIYFRKLVIHTENVTIFSDIDNLEIRVAGKANISKTFKFPDWDVNNSYSEMHKSILKDGASSCCDYINGFCIVESIESIRKQVKEVGKHGNPLYNLC